MVNYCKNSSANHHFFFYKFIFSPIILIKYWCDCVIIHVVKEILEIILSRNKNILQK